MKAEPKPFVSFLLTLVAVYCLYVTIRAISTGRWAMRARHGLLVWLLDEDPTMFWIGVAMSASLGAWSLFSGIQGLLAYRKVVTRDKGW